MLVIAAAHRARRVLAPHTVIDRIAADADVLARARRVQDLSNAAVLPDSRAERRRRLAEPDLEYRAFCTRRRLPASPALQPERAWDRALAIVETTADPMLCVPRISSTTLTSRVARLAVWP